MRRLLLKAICLLALVAGVPDAWATTVKRLTNEEMAQRAELKTRLERMERTIGYYAFAIKAEHLIRPYPVRKQQYLRAAGTIDASDPQVDRKGASTRPKRS